MWIDEKFMVMYFLNVLSVIYNLFFCIFLTFKIVLCFFSMFKLVYVHENLEKLESCRNRVDQAVKPIKAPIGILNSLEAMHKKFFIGADMDEKK